MEHVSTHYMQQGVRLGKEGWREKASVEKKLLPRLLARRVATMTEQLHATGAGIW